MPYTAELNSATVRRIIRTPRPLLTPLMLAALGIAGAARAQDGGSSVPSTKELLDRIERLEASNRALAGEVQTLRSSDENGWLSEERAAEIRGPAVCPVARIQELHRTHVWYLVPAAGPFLRRLLPLRERLLRDDSVVDVLDVDALDCG